jgi:hypothetical protein
MYIQVIFSAIDLASWRFLSLQLKVPTQVVQLIEKPYQPACASRKACPRSSEATVSHLMPALLPPVGKRVHDQLTWMTTALGLSSLVSLLAVADYEQVRNLPMPG